MKNMSYRATSPRGPSSTRMKVEVEEGEGRTTNAHSTGYLVASHYHHGSITNILGGHIDCLHCNNLPITLRLQPIFQ